MYIFNIYVYIYIYIYVKTSNTAPATAYSLTSHCTTPLHEGSTLVRVNILIRPPLGSYRRPMPRVLAEA